MRSRSKGGADAGALLDGEGRRKYLCESEGRRFLRVAAAMDDHTRAFCLLLSYTGCRISEALEVTPRRLDAEGGYVIFRTLKRRKRVFRIVPVPVALMRELKQLARGRGEAERLWLWSRQTAWRRVKHVMEGARISGPQAMPRGLRHQFGVCALEANMPLSLTQRLLGHASSRTTTLYQNVSASDARRLMQRMWRERTRAA